MVKPEDSKTDDLLVQATRALQQTPVLRAPSHEVLAQVVVAMEDAAKQQTTNCARGFPVISPIAGLSPVSQRVIVGGLGLSAVAATVFLMLWFVGPISPGAAMERMALALDRVNSYTYRMEVVYISRKEGRTVRDIVAGQWRTEPFALHGTTYVVETPLTDATRAAPKVLVDLEEFHQAAKRGIVIDHRRQQYWWIDEEYEPSEHPGASPQVVIYKVRQRRGQVLRDLGEKIVDGRLARGLEILLDDANPETDLGPAKPGRPNDAAFGWDWRNIKIKVWVDPKTDLPIEFRCTRRGDDEWVANYLFTDLRWNVEFAPDAFDASPPKGYTEIEDPRSFEQK